MLGGELPAAVSGVSATMSFDTIFATDAGGVGQS